MGAICRPEHVDTELIKHEIGAFLEKLGFGDELTSVEMHEGAMRRLGVTLEGRASVLIGEQGGNLAAFEHLLKKILRKKSGQEDQFTLDINDYRLHRLEDLKYDVKRAARAVRTYQRPMHLKSMSPFERRIVHLLLAEYPDLVTESEGADPYRRVVIKPFEIRDQRSEISSN